MMPQACAEEAAEASLDGFRGNCSALKRCLSAAMSASRLPGWQNARPRHAGAATAAATAAAASSAAAQASEEAVTIAARHELVSLELAGWFLLFFVVRHSIGHTLVIIPYDALGQELTSDSEARQVHIPAAAPRLCMPPARVHTRCMPARMQHATRIPSHWCMPRSVARFVSRPSASFCVEVRVQLCRLAHRLPVPDGHRRIHGDGHLRAGTLCRGGRRHTDDAVSHLAPGRGA